MGKVTLADHAEAAGRDLDVAFQRIGGLVSDARDAVEAIATARGLGADEHAQLQKSLSLVIDAVLVESGAYTGQGEPKRRETLLLDRIFDGKDARPFTSFYKSIAGK